MIKQTVTSQNFSWLNVFIPWLHLFGGSMIMAGLFTRPSVLIQLPILLRAVFFNSRFSIFAGEPDLFFSISILVLLVFFLVEGAGPLSLDNAFRNKIK